MLDVLMEVVFEVIFEGSFELGKSRQVPGPVRLIAIIVFGIISLGVAGVLLLVGVASFRWGAPLIGVALLVMLVFWIWYLLRTVRRFFR